MKVLASILCISIFCAQFPSAHAADNSVDGLWTQLCASGKWIKIELPNNDTEEPYRPAAVKLCHAICCSSDEDGSDCEEDNCE